MTTNNTTALQARLHVAEEEPSAGLQSLAHLMARVQRATAHAPLPDDQQLQMLHSHECDVSLPTYADYVCKAVCHSGFKVHALKPREL